MTVCPHCFTDSATIAWQASRIDELEESLKQAKEPVEEPDDYQTPVGVTLSPNEGRIFAQLLRREIVTRHRLIAITQRRTDAEPKLKDVDVWINRLRSKLRPLGIEIVTVYGIGYMLPRSFKASIELEIINGCERHPKNKRDRLGAATESARDSAAA